MLLILLRFPPQHDHQTFSLLERHTLPFFYDIEMEFMIKEFTKYSQVLHTMYKYLLYHSPTLILGVVIL
ncbi:MAG: hypothetical protein A2Y88_05160 [Chloroflexi bacterium RBG_13_48_10]|jgi:hypothetical protein|nr:MAG: hypothetical protein A2Y88_05160 [Chloroflexi bacterium RBG_13_48_10]